MGEWVPCVFVLSPIDFSLKSFNPLHVLSIKENYYHANVLDTTIAVITNFSVPPQSSALNLYVTIQWINEVNEKDKEFWNEIKNSEKYGVVFCASQLFLDHYEVDVTKPFFMKEIKPFPLERVTLGTSCDKTFFLCKQEQWNTEMTIGACHEKLLCRQGDIFLWRKSQKSVCKLSQDNFDEWDKFSVLECKNLLQGIITVKTVIVIVLIGADDTSDKDYKKYIQENPQEEVHPLVKHWELMRYTSNLLLPHSLSKRSLNPVLLIMSSAFLLMNSKSATLNVNIMPVLPFTNKCGNIDPLNTIIIQRSLGKKLNLAEKDWIKIMLKKEGAEFNMPIDSVTDIKHSKLRCAQVEFNDFTSDVDQVMQEQLDTVYMSPLLWFNLNDHPSPFLQENAKVVLQILETNPKKKSELIQQPQFAKEVMLALVQAPQYDTTEYFDNLLKAYFSIERYVQVDDIICAGSTEEPYYVLTSNEQRRLDSNMVYFKISQIKGPPSDFPGYLVDNLHTTVYQAGTVFSFVPRMMDVFLLSKPLHPIWYNPTTAGMEKYIKELQNLISPYMKSFVREQVLPCFLLVGPNGCGKQALLKAICRRVNIHYHVIECHDLLAETSSATETKLKQALIAGSQFAPCVLTLKNIHILCKMRDTSREDYRVLNVLQETISSLLANTDHYPLLLFGTTTDLALLPVDVTSYFFHHIIIEQPNEEERSRIISGLLANANFTTDVSINAVANKTQGYILGDLCALISLATHIAYRRVVESCCDDKLVTYEDEENIFLAGVCLQQSDFTKALENLNTCYSSAIGAPKVPSVKWDDVGGLQDVKDAILDTVQLPLRHPELTLTGLRRSGILLFGPPGTGKTLLAKAVATECSLHFLSVKGPELLNMYVGQSEENIREVFRRAHDVAPCIIFFDELDSLAPNRGRSGDSGGVMDRVVSQLLAELDGLTKMNNVFVVGATNRPDLIDPALLRPGRFDRLLYVGIGEDKNSQLKILKALTRKFNLASDVSLDDIISQCPPNLTGSDFYALCSDALLQAVSRSVDYININSKEKKAPLLVCMKDFQNAIEKLVPSVSLADLQRYEVLRESLAN